MNSIEVMTLEFIGKALPDNEARDQHGMKHEHQIVDLDALHESERGIVLHEIIRQTVGAVKQKSSN